MTSETKPFIKVKTVYGETCRVSREDFNDPNRIQLRLFNHLGRPVEWDKRKCHAITLHRENIAP